MKLEEAKAIAIELISPQTHLIKDHFKKMLICGSIRRKQENVHDIDIVAIEKSGFDYKFGEPSLNYRIECLDPDGRNQPKDEKRFLLGPKLKRFMYKGISVDLYLANEKTFETLVLIRTGSKEHNIRLTTLAMGKNMKLKAGGEGLVDRENESMIYEDTEDGILMKLLGRIPKPEARN